MRDLIQNMIHHSRLCYFTPWTNIDILWQMTVVLFVVLVFALLYNICIPRLTNDDELLEHLIFCHLRAQIQLIILCWILFDCLLVFCLNITDFDRQQPLLLSCVPDQVGLLMISFVSVFALHLKFMFLELQMCQKYAVH